MRAALGEYPAPRPGQRAPRPVLDRLERRAIRIHRRRQRAALTTTAAAAVVVVAVGGLVLPQLTSFGPLSGALSGARSVTGAAGPAGPAGGTTPQAGAVGGSAPDNSTSPTTNPTTSTPPAGPPAVSEASLLTAADAEALFAVPAVPGQTPQAAQELTVTSCSTGSAGSAGPISPAASVTVAWESTAPPPENMTALILTEEVSSFTDPAQALAAVASLRAVAAAECASPGFEGVGPTQEVDAAGLAPAGGEAVVLATTDAYGTQSLQVVVATAQGLMVCLGVSSVHDDHASAWQAFAPVAQAALARATSASSASSAASAAPGTSVQP